MAILIPHSTTPTGFGIRQRLNGAFRTTSPCCGRSLIIDSSEIKCKGCSHPVVKISTRPDMVGDKNFPNPILAALWISRMTGYTDVEVEYT